MDRSLEDEVRILRRVVARRNTKVLDGEPLVRIQGKQQGISAEAFIELRLLEMPPPDSLLPEELQDLVVLGFEHAQRICQQRGFKKVIGVDFDGKAWKAKFQVF